MFEQGMSRRNFFKGAGVAAAGVMGASFMAGCAPSAPAAKTEDAQGSAAATDWLGAAPEIAESDVVKTVDTEIIVVGAGTSGTFAACSAVEEGAQCILIEKPWRRRGGRRHSRHLGGFGVEAADCQQR